MKKIVLSIMLGLSFLACTEAKPTGSSISQNREERAVNDFTGISTGGNFNVYVTLGTQESLRLEGNEELIKEIETKVEKGTLKIQYKTKKHYWDWNSSDKKRVNIYITAKTLTNLTVSGSGDMKVEGTVKTPDLRTTVSGSGSLVLSAEAVKLFATVSGSGNMNISGNAQYAELTTSGSGNLSASNLKTKNAVVTVSGSGNTGLFVENTLKATLSGSGNIKYSGEPNVTKTISGSGRIGKF